MHQEEYNYLDKRDFLKRCETSPERLYDFCVTLLNQDI